MERWKGDPTTQAVMALIQGVTQDLMRAWSRRNFQADEPNVTQGLNAHALGQIALAQRILELTHEELTEALSDDDT
jgi:hypothetical protein